MLRFAITELEGAGGELPPIDLEGDVVIGSGATAHVRLPASVARDEHVRVGADGAWTVIGDAMIDGVERRAGERGAVGDGVKIAINGMAIEVMRSPVGAAQSGPMRTASLARELVRSLLGDGGAPTLAVEQGPMAGTSRSLPPPVASIVIGRGDEATWVIIDGDLSRTHAEIRRDWDGVHVRDLASKNGTKLDGVEVDEAGSLMADGALLELGSVALRFTDPAEKHLRGDLPVPQAAIRLRMPSIPPSASGKKRTSGQAPIAIGASGSGPALKVKTGAGDAAAGAGGRSPMFWIALAVAGAAIGAAIWVLVS